MWNCLLQATKDKMKSIAFPAIGTGNLMYPIESVADAMMSTVEKFRDEQSTTLISVFFVIFDTGTLQVYHIIRNVEKKNNYIMIIWRKCLNFFLNVLKNNCAESSNLCWSILLGRVIQDCSKFNHDPRK